MQLVNIDQLRPVAYNPRKADEYRLSLLELSIKKLGFVLPIYSTETGEILSGHQRHLIAERIGLEKVPVEFVSKQLDDSAVRGLNIAFNRGTNDMSWHDDSKKLRQKLSPDELTALGESLPELTDYYRCLSPVMVSNQYLIDQNPDILTADCEASMADCLRIKKIRMPCIISQSGKIINGKGRILASARLKESEYHCVVLSDKEADFATAMINYLSMDFAIEDKYADLLRHNSFRRARSMREVLGRGFIFACGHSKANHEFDLKKNLNKWVRIHGKTILDFGAGHLNETNILRQHGINAIPFEPYHITGNKDQINKEASLGIVDYFLEQIASGIKFDSIFISSVLNSVPFLQDRRYILAIVASLCSNHTAVFACASSTQQPMYDTLSTGKTPKNSVHIRSRQFLLDYEPGIMLGDIGLLPKVQKQHTPQEFKQLFSEFFDQVGITHSHGNCQAVSTGAKPIDKDFLLNAIKFEFDLPYPDGSRMGRVNQAIQAFTNRGIL